MSVDTVKIVAERFLKSNKSDVLALKGSWGVGKTYTWDQIVKSHKNSTELKYYCYISLFGISSISQLALLIFTTTREIKLHGTTLDFNVINESWFSLAKSGVKSIAHLARKGDFPYSKNFSVGLDQLASSMINDTIVCLDDFERSQLSAEEIMGFISYLKEERNCKVVLIFNQEKLGKKEGIYKNYREKVIDIELLFAPSPTEAIGLAFPVDMPYLDIAKQYAINLQIVNIRLLKKIVDVIELIKPHIEGLHAGVIQQAVMTLVLFVWAYYDTNENKPDLAFILKWEKGIWNFGEDNKNDDDPKAKTLEAILVNYGITRIDEFDYAISKVIEYGHIEETGLSQEAFKLNEKFNAIEKENSFTEAWNLFHNTFSDNTDELITALSESFKKSYLQVSPLNLNSTVRLLRQLRRNAIADWMIEFYVENRKSNLELFDLDDYPFAGEIDDAKLRECFKKAFTSGHQLPTLLDVVLDIAKKHGMSKKQIQVVEQATEDDFYQLFLESQGDNLIRVVRACLQFETMSGYQHLADKPRAALEKIGGLSELNKLRVRKFGVTLKSST